MRQTTEHQSYGEAVGVASFHGLNPRTHGFKRRSGFTLIEVVVAISILVVVVLALVSSYYGYYVIVQNERYKTTGQNLAELQLEDIQGMSVGVLAQIVGEGKPDGLGYYPTPPNPLDLLDPVYLRDNYRDTDPSASVFDSGSGSVLHPLVSGEFRVYNLTSVSALGSVGIPGIGVETVSGSSPAIYNVILYSDVYPGYKKRVIITDLAPDVAAASKKIFSVQVTVYWQSRGVQKQVTVDGLKNDLD